MTPNVAVKAMKQDEMKGVSGIRGVQELDLGAPPGQQAQEERLTSKGMTSEMGEKPGACSVLQAKIRKYFRRQK